MKESRTIARILKVNHAGEYGASRLYRAQLDVSRLRYPDLVPFLEQTLAHEQEHCAKFKAAMPARDARSCAAMPLWGVGGYLLGLLTASMGRNAVMVCTAAVEATVHRHLEDQIRFLEDRDEELRRLILAIQVDELQHLGYAEQRLRQGPVARLLYRSVEIVTEALIFLSTQGDVVRMTKAISGQHGANKKPRQVSAAASR